MTYLTDIDMPIMSGRELLKKVKRELKLDTPMVSITAFAVAGDIERVSLQIDDIFNKPLNSLSTTSFLAISSGIRFLNNVLEFLQKIRFDISLTQLSHLIIR